MKRRIIATIITLITATCLTSCGAPKHNWQSTWTYGPYEHWHECADEGCNTITDVGEHTMVDGKCSLCGYNENNP